MNLILKEIAVNRKIFIMLFIGFTLTILPILIAMSIRDYYDEKFYEYKNGYFKYYYTVQLTSFGELDFKAIQEVTGTSFKNSSVITNNMRMGIPGIGEVTMVGLINKNWSPPLIKGSRMEDGEENSVIAGKRIYKESETIKLFSREYRVKGVSAANTGYAYNSNVFVGLSDMPDEIKRRMQNENTFEMIVRSNENPKQEIDTFIRYIKQNRIDTNVKVINEKENYENEKSSNKAMRAQLTLPYNLLFIAVMNCIIASYFWIYTKKKSISLRKTLGASNLNLIVFIFSQLFICAIVAAICAICMQWILSTMNKSIVHVMGFTIHIDVFKVVMSVVISLFISFITAVIPFFKILKIEPAKALKE
ncbi:ABC transporter permease [Bacillus pacificus]|nr:MULTISPECIES: ABC transporter permease [Bacillus cereus group]ASI78433.1 ABC transporter permease [Bacillus cereus]KXI53415.1 ABC transporter permease [Bacillus cereus]KYQ04556.1 ABC transporter permease protein [Bacillus cereus]MCC2351166.1 ABC transporter permease [Bacillus pacificus]MCC2389266.1 ABC transporter permease [Bacillus pacificus]